ncbi:heme biosynthesis HemY N-terminal domain-containing protein [Methylotetracoccus oryzae]|uniref:heme biosynthesis HemY N-terminal domain-containing protein n=1 Tax=Methylotetracoccus oryzae TaxID=1919059 RepID=UPI0011189ACD|nr:heme biosynthesis HemY N-terminal domain-containing protein [Methylotetracoccus oryzae]
MRKLLLLLLAVGLAAGGGYYVYTQLASSEDPGYVIVGYGGWALETSLFVVATALFFAFIALYACIRLVIQTLRLPTILRRRTGEKRTRRSNQALISGLIETAEGNWEKAERNLIRHAADSGLPLINYLTAARAAHSRGAIEQRDEYLKLAHENVPEAEFAVGLIRAELQLSNQQFEDALESLTELEKIAPSHAAVLRLQHQVYSQMEDWEGLRRLIPSLHSSKVMMEAEIKLLETSTFAALLRSAAERRQAQELEALWKTIPEHVRAGQGIQTLFFAAMIEAGAAEEIEGRLRAALTKEWNDTLLALYGAMKLPDAAGQLARAETWYSKHQKDPVLLRILGKLALRADDLPKARGYLENSLALEESVEGFRLMGDVLLKSGDPAGAAQFYRRGLFYASDEVITQIEQNPTGDSGVELGSETSGR